MSKRFAGLAFGLRCHLCIKNCRTLAAKTSTRSAPPPSPSPGPSRGRGDQIGSTFPLVKGPLTKSPLLWPKGARGRGWNTHIIHSSRICTRAWVARGPGIPTPVGRGVRYRQSCKSFPQGCKEAVDCRGARAACGLVSAMPESRVDSRSLTRSRGPEPATTSRLHKAVRSSRSPLPRAVAHG